MITEQQWNDSTQPTEPWQTALGPYAILHRWTSVRALSRTHEWTYTRCGGRRHVLATSYQCPAGRTTARPVYTDTILTRSHLSFNRLATTVWALMMAEMILLWYSTVTNSAVMVLKLKPKTASFKAEPNRNRYFRRLCDFFSGISKMAQPNHKSLQQ